MRAASCAASRVASCAAVLAGGCTAPNPFFDLGPLTDVESAEILRARTRCTAPLTARLVISYRGPDFRGTFDAVAAFEPPATMRVHAYKDVIITVEPIFDLAFTPARYEIEVYGDDDETTVDQGPSSAFPAKHPRYRGFYWAREALVLPGSLTDVLDTTRLTDGTLAIESRLKSGAWVRWFVDPATLEVRRGVVDLGDGSFAFAEYSRYRRIGELFVPGRVRFRDDAQRIALEVWVGEVEVTLQGSDP